MSEFADEYQRQHSKPKGAVSMGVAPETGTPAKGSSPQPNDAVLTNWIVKDDVCAGEDAPLVCAPVPAPFNVAVPGMQSVAPPQPTHWASLAPSLATCPTEMMSGEPAYKPAYESENLEMYKVAFTSSWNDVRTSYNGLVTLHRAYRDREKEIIPILQVDASAGVGAGVQGIDAAKSFVGGKLRPSQAKMDSSKLSPELRAQIFKAQDKVKLSELDIASKRDLVTNANDTLRQAANSVEIATNNIDIVKSDTEIEHLQLDKDQIKRDVEDFKARVKASVESVKFVTSIINCWSDPTKLFGNVLGAVNQGATAGGAMAEATYTVDANAKLATLDGQIRGLKNYKGGLLATNAEKTLHNALIEVDKKVNEAKIAVRSMEASKLAHRDAYREMGTLIEKAGAASGLNPKDRKAVAAAVEAVPKIEMIQQQLQGMDEGLQPPPYNEASGTGAAMASNLGVFTHALSVVKGNREYVAELKALWEARRASVLAVVDQTVSVSGAE